MIYTKQSTPLAVPNSEMLVIGLSLKWRQLRVCPLIDHGSRPIKTQNELWLLYNFKLIIFTIKYCRIETFMNAADVDTNKAVFLLTFVVYDCIIADTVSILAYIRHKFAE